MNTGLFGDLQVVFFAILQYIYQNINRMHYSIKRLSFYVFCLVTLSVESMYSQDVIRDSYSNGGRDAINSGIEISYNIGEPVIFTGISSNAILTQGFEQEDLMIFTRIELFGRECPVNVFPNPLTDKLVIDFSGEGMTDIILTVYDIQGKQIKEELMSPPVFYRGSLIVDFTAFSKGIYLVKLSSVFCACQATFKISKT
jgi:hypothetical protein